MTNKKYEVVVYYTLAKLYDSAAETPEGAVEGVLHRASISPCHQCARACGSGPEPTGYAVVDADGKEVLAGDV